MHENDNRTEHRGIKLGQLVHFRWSRKDRSGVVRRLMSTKALIGIAEPRGPESRVYISYRQIRETAPLAVPKQPPSPELMEAFRLAGMSLSRLARLVPKDPPRELIDGEIDLLNRRFLSLAAAAGVEPGTVLSPDDVAVLAGATTLKFPVA